MSEDQAHTFSASCNVKHYKVTLSVYVEKVGLSKRTNTITSDQGCVGTEKERSSVNSMNNIVANLLLNMTSSARFEGMHATTVNVNAPHAWNLYWTFEVVLSYMFYR